MAPSKGNGRGSADDNENLRAGMNGNSSDGAVAPGYTGRYLVLLRQDAMDAGINALSDRVGLNVTRSADFASDAVDTDNLASGGAIVFEDLAVAVVDTPPDQFRSLSAMASEDNGILAIEPERVVYAIFDRMVETSAPLSGGVSLGQALPPSPMNVPSPSMPHDYLRGYRDAVNHVVDQVLGGSSSTSAVGGGMTRSIFPPETDLTWGLQATRVAESRYTGKGVRVAVLDTGFDLGHPDFVGRLVTAQSFVAGETAQDGHGHGTHCIGTACGPKQGGQLPRYGIAYDAEIFVGKVLSNRGSGTDASILAGIQWAIANKCAVISMSLGAPTEPGQAFSRIYETVAKRALAAGTLIVAAAGNESRRPGQINPVSHPANCPSIMAVAALDSNLKVAPFSCGGLTFQGGQVDIAGPGVAVRSSWPRPLLYRTISGTSMATPHVAGIAALLAEQNPDVRGGSLGWLLLQSARRLDLSAQDAGAGLVQAP
ncbi:MAG TPA: S8 family serine peptidase [Herpetosiphonaceae bacterium]